MEKPTLFYGFRLRHALALLISLGIILMLAGYFSVSAGQRASLEAIIAQGRALTESLISSAEMVIESDNAITSIAIDKLIGIVGELDVNRSLKDESALEGWRQVLDAEKVAVIQNRKVISASSTGASFLDNLKIQNWLDSLEIDPEADIIYDFRTIGSERIFWGYFPVEKNLGLFAAINWKYGQYGNQRLSLYYLLNQVGQESGIEYIMLQNQDGIVFASKKIASMPRLSDDSFLVESLKSDSTRSRLIMFQDRQILETVRIFKSRDFEGLFRVGLSLYGYRQIASSVRRQIWLVVAALIIIGMLAFGAITGFQNFEFLKLGLEKSRVISQSLLDSIPGPVIAINSDLKITDINSAAKSRPGVPAGLAENSDYTQAFPGDPFQFRQVLETKRSASFERVFGEDRRHYYITTTPLVASDGAIMGAISVAQDITDARRLEATAESRRRFSELGALAASMAHEIRNPLNAIGITIQRMRNEIKPAGSQDDYHKFIDGLRSEIKRLNDIIEKFLAVARSARPEFSSIDIKGLIRDVLELFESQAQSQDIKLSSNIPNHLSVEGDKAGLTQALVNIIKNSLEAVEEKGTIEIRAQSEGDKVRVSVIDNGMGIADIDSALKPFYTTKKEGTGLGLATASKIMVDQGGELIIESTAGHGCRIDLLMPSKRTDL